MAHSPPAGANIPERASGINAILPIGPIMPSNSDYAMTLTFEASEVSQELRAAIIKRTKNRWAWFSRAEDLDEERGTQLGTLGYLPWEIRQKIFEEFFEGNFHEKEYPPGHLPPFFGESIGAWQIDDVFDEYRIYKIRMASASLKSEVEYAFLTMMYFDFCSIEAMIHFLGRLTTYERGLLRSIRIPLTLGTDIKAAKESCMEACADLPSGLTTIIFHFRYTRSLLNYNLKTHGMPPKLVDYFELFGKQIVRCWAPRVNVRTNWENDSNYYYTRTTSPSYILSSLFQDLEAWSQEWLEWWENFQEGDQVEEQCLLSADHSDWSLGKR